jgi:hypothetical protein
MRLFLQIDIGDWKQRDYGNRLISYASSLADDLVGTDMDNESESQVADIVLRLVEQAESVFVFISATTFASMGSAGKTLDRLRHHENKVHRIVLLGEHTEVEKLAEVFESRFLVTTDKEQVKKLIHDFAKKITTPDQTSGHAP